VKHHISTAVQGAYLLESNFEGSGAECLVVGFHGFGELAEKQMGRMLSAEWQLPVLFCSIQALHPMYNKDGSPGASWMTFLDRDLVIRDNLNYVKNVLKELRRDYTWESLVFCGFSQGASMAHRATLNIGCDLLLTTGGDIPPEQQVDDLSGYPATVVVRGERDRIYTKGIYDGDIACLKQNGVDVTPLIVKGGHKWPSVITGGLAERCRALAAQRY